MKGLGSLAALVAALPAAAATSEPLSLFGISAGKSGSGLSVPMQIVILLTLMTLLPAAIMISLLLLLLYYKKFPREK